MTSRALLAAVFLAFAILAARWMEEGDYYDPLKGRRHCAAPPSAIKDWSSTGRTRRPTDSTNLERWLRENPDEVNRLFGPFCRAPLHLAARFGRDDLAELLIARGADVRAADEPEGHTALHLAAQYGQAAVAATLVARGAEVNARTRSGRTPLHDAAFGLAGTSDIDGRVEVVRLLLARGADVNARARGSNRTPLDDAEGTASINPGNSERMAALLREAGAIRQPPAAPLTR